MQIEHEIHTHASTSKQQNNNETHNANPHTLLLLFNEEIHFHTNHEKPNGWRRKRIYI
jgi:hypothetical protein